MGLHQPSIPKNCTVHVSLVFTMSSLVPYRSRSCGKSLHDRCSLIVSGFPWQCSTSSGVLVHPLNFLSKVVSPQHGPTHGFFFTVCCRCKHYLRELSLVLFLVVLSPSSNLLTSNFDIL